MARASTARLFVAVDPPEDVSDQLTAWTRTALRSGAGRPGARTAMRVLGSELLHVTLCFLGNRPTEEIDLLAARIGECERAACELSLGAPLWLPARRPRALAVEVHDDTRELTRTHTSVLGAVGEPSRGSPRRFRPHVTVARVRGDASPRTRELPPTPQLRFAPHELVLYRSWLSPEGASYEALASYPLG